MRPIPINKIDDQGCSDGECVSDFLENVWTVGNFGWSEAIPDHFDEQIREDRGTFLIFEFLTNTI